MTVTPNPDGDEYVYTSQSFASAAIGAEVEIRLQVKIPGSQRTYQWIDEEVKTGFVQEFGPYPPDSTVYRKDTFSTDDMRHVAPNAQASRGLYGTR